MSDTDLEIIPAETALSKMLSSPSITISVKTCRAADQLANFTVSSVIALSGREHALSVYRSSALEYLAMLRASLDECEAALMRATPTDL